jgi:hypothetical protein
LPQLWQLAQQHVASNEQVPFLRSERVQHDATFQLEERLYRELHARSTPIRRALLTAVTAPSCSAFLSTLPTQPSYRMADEAVRLAVRHRLGLLPFESLARQQCTCRFHTAFAADPDHFHSCEQFKRMAITVRHNNLVQVLQDLAVSVGFSTTREPNSHIRPPGIADKPPHSAAYNEHADLLLLRHDTKLYIDVTVVRPTSDSSLKKPLTLTKPLHMTTIRAQRKRTHYAAICQANGYTMVPFVVETYGGLGAEATQLLRTLAAHSKEYSPRAFLEHARKRLSATLQASNANIALECMQSFHLRQHAGNPAAYDSYQRKRIVGYAAPADSDRLAGSMQGVLSAAAAQAADARAAAHRAADRHSIAGSSSSGSSVAHSDPDAPCYVHAGPIGRADFRPRLTRSVSVDAGGALSVSTDQPSSQLHDGLVQLAAAVSVELAA